MKQLNIVKMWQAKSRKFRIISVIALVCILYFGMKSFTFAEEVECEKLAAELQETALEEVIVVEVEEPAQEEIVAEAEESVQEEIIAEAEAIVEEVVEAVEELVVEEAIAEKVYNGELSNEEAKEMIRRLKLKVNGKEM